MSSSTNVTQSSDFNRKMRNVGLIFLGAIIIVITLAIYKSNVYIFIVFFSMYVAIFCIVIVIYLYKKVSTTNPEFNFIVNVALYTICFAVAIIFFSIYLFTQAANFKITSKY